MTREKIEFLIIRHWSLSAVPFYFSQVLSGECSIQETIDDLLSLEREQYDYKN